MGTTPLDPVGDESAQWALASPPVQDAGTLTCDHRPLRGATGQPLEANRVIAYNRDGSTAGGLRYAFRATGLVLSVCATVLSAIASGFTIDLLVRRSARAEAVEAASKPCRDA